MILNLKKSRNLKIIKFLQFYIKKYQLETIFRLLLYLILIWIIGSTWLYFTEKDYILTADEIAQGQKNYFNSYFNSFRNNLVYIFSGFEEYVPHTTAGWFGSIFVMLFGSLGILALLIGNVTSIIHERAGDSHFIPPLPDYKNLSNHIVICNWNSKGYEIIKQHHDSVIKEQKTIVIISDFADKIPILNSGVPRRIFKKVFAIKGKTTNKTVLLKASITNADTVIILAEDEGKFLFQKKNEYSNIKQPFLRLKDAKTILTGMLIESINSEIHTITELVNKENKIYLERTHIDEIISMDDISSKLISQTTLNPGLNKLYLSLLTASKNSNEIYIVNIPNNLINKSYKEILNIINSSFPNIILIGFSTRKKRIINGKEIRNTEGKIIFEKEFIINPTKKENKIYNINYKLRKNDSLILIAYEKPILK